MFFAEQAHCVRLVRVLRGFSASAFWCAAPSPRGLRACGRMRAERRGPSDSGVSVPLHVAASTHRATHVQRAFGRIGPMCILCVLWSVPLPAARYVCARWRTHNDTSDNPRVTYRVFCSLTMPCSTPCGASTPTSRSSSSSRIESTEVATGARVLKVPAAWRPHHAGHNA